MADHPPSGGLSGLDKLAQQEIYSHMRFYRACQTGEGEDSLIVIWWAAMVLAGVIMMMMTRNINLSCSLFCFSWPFNVYVRRRGSEKCIGLCKF